MNIVSILLVGILVLSTVPSKAAIQPFHQKNKFTVIRDGVASCNIQNRRYDFRMEVISDFEGLKFETEKKGHSFITAKTDERYAVRLHNPLPVRVAVNLTVDGLNTITGKPSGIADGSKWIIDPYSYVTIRGWQVNEGESRRFFFTEKPRTYAAWRGEQLNKDLAVNCGVIGAAYFWSKKELQDHFDQNPTYVYSQNDKQNWRSTADSKGQSTSAKSHLGGVPAAEALNAPQESRLENEKAGTGMGERESHPTRYVDFHYDTGMYKAHQALIVYYDFAPESKPNPFPGLSYAPEMD